MRSTFPTEAVLYWLDAGTVKGETYMEGFECVSN